MANLLINRNKIIHLGLITWFIFILIGCRNSASPIINQSNTTKVVEPSPILSPSLKNAASDVVLDVPQFAYKSAAEIEMVLGKPLEIKTVKGDAKQPPGEYRLYQTPNHPQGLSIHFYNDQALIFNLVLGNSVNQPREALAKYLAIDVKTAAPIEKTQFLEKWRGKFNNVNFTSVYAMKERIEKDDYKLLHAEAAAR